MYNRNINGLITVSPKIEAITADAIAENAFGITIEDLAYIAKRPDIVPVLRFPSTTAGKFVEYTLTGFKNVSGGYEFKFISDTGILVLTTNNTTKKYSCAFTPFADQPEDVVYIDISDIPRDETYDNEHTNAHPFTAAILDAYENGKFVVVKQAITDVDPIRYHYGYLIDIAFGGVNKSRMFPRFVFPEVTGGNVVEQIAVYNYADAETRTIYRNIWGAYELPETIDLSGMIMNHTYANADITGDILWLVNDLIAIGDKFARFTYGDEVYTLTGVERNTQTGAMTVSAVCDEKHLTMTITDFVDPELMTFITVLKDDNESVSVTADGVKTTAELIKELIEIDTTKITRRSVLIIQNETLFLPVTYRNGADMIFNASTANDTKCHIRNVFYDGTSVHCYIWEFDTTGNGVSSFGSTVPTEGETITLIY